MKIDPERGTGRTQRMLERAISDHADNVFVVAHTHEFARQLCSRVADMMGDDVGKRTADGITRADGRYIGFTSAEYVNSPRFKGVSASVHWDHYAK